MSVQGLIAIMDRAVNPHLEVGTHRGAYNQLSHLISAAHKIRTDAISKNPVSSEPRAS